MAIDIAKCIHWRAITLTVSAYCNLPTSWAYHAHTMGTLQTPLPRSPAARVATHSRGATFSSRRDYRCTSHRQKHAGSIKPHHGSVSYFTLDNAKSRALARHEPRTFVSQAPRLTIDEIQRQPDLLVTIKVVVDRDNHPGQFVLTGSANLLSMKRVSESLAGRARYLTLWPMTRREQLGFGSAGCWSSFMEKSVRDWMNVVDEQSAPAENWRELAMRGGYPQPAFGYPELNQSADRAELFSGYTQTYPERDLRDLASVDSSYDFQRLMRAVCQRIGNVVHQSDLARDTGLARTSVQRYLNLLEVSYQLVRVETYAVNRTKRLMKLAKYYWSDTGLALHIGEDGAPRGAHLENLVLTDLLAWRETDATRPGVMYRRTSGGEEVDFVVERKQQSLPIEVKASTNPGYADAKHLRTFLTEYPNAIGGLSKNKLHAIFNPRIAAHRSIGEPPVCCADVMYAMKSSVSASPL